MPPYNYRAVFIVFINTFMKFKNLITIGLILTPLSALAGTTLNGAGA